MTNKTKSTLLVICLMTLFNCMPIRGATIPDSSELSDSDRQRSEMMSPASPSDGVEVKAPDGAPVEIKLRLAVFSQTAMKNDLINFEVVRPLKVNDVTVIEKGALATARITKVKKAGHWGRDGKIAWELQQVVTADGSYVPLQLATEVSGHEAGILASRKFVAIGNAVPFGVVALLSLGVSRVALVALPFYVLRWRGQKGRNVMVSTRTRFLASVRGDHWVRGRVLENPSEQR